MLPMGEESILRKRHMAGDDLYSFPTPSEAFGVRTNHRKPPTPITSQSSASSTYSRNPPPHLNYTISSNGRSNGPGVLATPPKLVHQVPPLPQQQQQGQRAMSSNSSASSIRPQQIPQQHFSNPHSSTTPQQFTPQYSQQQQQQQQQQQYHQYSPQVPQQPQQSKSNQGRIPSVTSSYDSPGMQEYQTPLPNLPKDPAHKMDASQLLGRQLRELFDRVDRNRDGRLDENELGSALANDDGTRFQLSTVRLMIRLFDTDDSNGIEFKEFSHLWSYILHWRKTFQKFDVDHNQKISFGEFQSAIESFGYRLPTDIVLFIFQKFGDFNANKPMTLKFDMFVESLIWLLRCTNIFKKFDLKGNGIATISFQDFVHEFLAFV